MELEFRFIKIRKTNTKYVLWAIRLMLLLHINVEQVQWAWAQTPKDSLPPKNTIQERYLVMDRLFMGRHKRLRYRQGEEIFFKLKGNKTLHRGIVMYVGDTTLLLAEYSKPILISNIRAIRTYSNSGVVRQGKLLFFVGALVFFAMDFFGANERDITRLPQRSYITAGSLAIAGILCGMFSQRTYRMNQRNILKVIAHP